MIRILAALLLAIAGFASGIVYERFNSGQTGELQSEVNRLETENTQLNQRIEELRNTLNLVKRQIQTDRIAYQALQESVGSTDTERDELRKQLEDQRKLLKALKQKLEQLEN